MQLVKYSLEREQRTRHREGVLLQFRRLLLLRRTDTT
jgi:hypothetical protein